MRIAARAYLPMISGEGMISNAIVRLYGGQIAATLSAVKYETGAGFVSVGGSREQDGGRRPSH